MKRIFCAIVALIALISVAKETTYNPVDKGTYRWSDSANWSAGVPEAGDVVIVNINSGKIILDVANPRISELILVQESDAPLNILSDGNPVNLVIDMINVTLTQAFLLPSADVTITVKGLSYGSTVNNAGAGNIVFDTVLASGDVNSVVQNGRGSFSFKEGVPEFWAPNPLVHLDASDASSFVYKEVDNPESGVIRWNGVNGAGYAYHDLASAPNGTQVLPKRIEGVLNGKAIVDFGEWHNLAAKGGPDWRPLGGYLFFQCGPDADLNVYTAFIVETAKAFLFGAKDQGAGYIIHGYDDWKGMLFQPRNETHLDFEVGGNKYTGGVSTGLGYVSVNGVTVAPQDAKRSGENIYDTIGLRAETRPIHISRLCYDRTYRSGGAKIAEVILYSRKLTDEEFKNTENYLRNKWQNADVNVVVMKPKNIVPQIIKNSSTPINIEDDAVLETGTLTSGASGATRLGFTGGGTLRLERSSVGLAGGADTAVEIGDGTLEPVKSAAVLQAPDANPIHDTSFHLDASDESSFTLDENDNVLEWRDVTGNGRAALYVQSLENETALPPRRVPALLNGKAGVDFGEWTSKKTLLWNHTNETMRTVFVVYGTISSELSFFIGNVNLADVMKSCCMHRGEKGMMFYNNYTAEAVRRGDIRVNGKSVQWNAHFIPQDPCLVMIASPEDKYTLCGSAFATDRFGRGLGRTGGQQICEVVIYDRVLGDAEKNDVQNWLMAKWLPKTPAGFALKTGEEQFDELRSVATSSETATVAVDEGTELGVGSISGANIAKSGKGALKVGSVADIKGALCVEDGTVEITSRTLPDAYELPAGYTDGSTPVNDVRAVFAVHETDVAMAIPAYVSVTDVNDALRVDGVRTTTIPAGVHVASHITVNRRTSAAIDPAASKIKEILVYRRAVTDLERRDIEAYLARKWNVGALPGYIGATQHLANLATGAGMLKATGSALVIDSVSGSGVTTVEGDVTVADAGSLDGAVKVGQGTELKFSNRVGIREDGIPTEGLIARFDMSHSESLTTVKEGDKIYVTEWKDLTGKHVAKAAEGHRPWILEKDCNGLDVLCTGPIARMGQSDWDNRDLAGYMYWDNTAIMARTVIEVIGVQEGGNFIVTSSYRGHNCIHRGANATGGSYADALLMVRAETSTPGHDSENAFFSINGVRVDQKSTGFPSPDYHSVVVRVDPDKTYEGVQTHFYVGQFGADRDYRYGGQRICEFIAYDRVLSDEEVKLLEAYMQRKWFGRNYDGFVSPNTGSIVLDGGRVNLAGDSRYFTSVSGTGVITGGDLNLLETFAPNGITINGKINFAASGGEIVLPRMPAKGEFVELGTAEGITGDWKSWTVSPLPPYTTGRVRFLNGKFGVQVSGTPFLFSIR